MRWVTEEDLPTLGICRGVQALNVAMGGTLVQDLSLIGLEPRTHEGRQRNPRPPEWQPIHEVQLGRRSRLRRVFGSEVLPVNSFHHQAVDRPGPAVDIVARSADGVVEALEAREYRFIIGVQWHPERMRPQSTIQAIIFEELIAEARRTRNGNGGAHASRGSEARPTGS
jgi:putative glutamine amidotransferase